MPKTSTCPNCNKSMEHGFIPDFSFHSDAHSVLQAMWHPGDPEDRHFLGVKTGMVKMEKSQAREIVSYRCPDCGLLESYAK